MTDCILCQKYAIRFIENEFAWAMFDEFPVCNGHTLIVPKRHVKDFFHATAEEKIAMLELIDRAKEIIDTKYSPDGYNIGTNCGETAGQTVMHLHIHLIPRYKGDVQDPRGGVRGVIPTKQHY